MKILIYCLGSPKLNTCMTSLRIIAPCRIHLFLIDENWYTGRAEGGIGLMLDRPNVVFEASNNAKEFKSNKLMSKKIKYLRNNL